VGKVQPETGIPAAVLRGAAGFAILSIAKASLRAADAGRPLAHRIARVMVNLQLGLL
jgi:hypothetical protein